MVCRHSALHGTSRLRHLLPTYYCNCNCNCNCSGTSEDLCVSALMIGGRAGGRPDARREENRRITKAAFTIIPLTRLVGR